MIEIYNAFLNTSEEHLLFLFVVIIVFIVNIRLIIVKFLDIFKK